MSKVSLVELAEEVGELNVALGWRNLDTRFAEYIALLHSEASEALEAWRAWKLEDATGLDGTTKPEGVGSELADVFIRLLDMCQLYAIDLQTEYDRKMAYNRTREYLHGGKTL